MLRGFFDTRTVVGNLIIINILAFLVTLFFGDGLYNLAGLFLPGSDNFKPFQLFTHVFMHGNFFHLFFNMYALGLFGIALEQVWGPKRFLTFYLITAFGAAFLHLGVNYFETMQIKESLLSLGYTAEDLKAMIETGRYMDLGGDSANLASKYYMKYNTPTVGASGAVFGILLGFGMLFPNTELMLLFFPIPIKAKWFVIGYGLIELFGGIRNSPTDNVAHFAHLGGMLFAFILIKIWERNRNQFY